MKILFGIMLLILINLNISFAQEGNCKSLILDYRDFVETDSTKWNLTLLKDEKIILLYYGATHSKDPLHLQFVEIERAWNSAKFDIALFEGPNRGIQSTKEETIEKLGESGFLRFLASRDSVEVQSLEPNPILELKYLKEYFPIDKIKLFYLLREAQRVRVSFNWDESQIKNHIETVLSKANALPELNEAVSTLQEIAQLFVEYWGNEIKWWEAPSNWFDPLQQSEKTGGIFTNDINRYSSNYRNLHMYELITNNLKSNKRIIAVVGRNHVPMQSKALECEWMKLNTSHRN